MRPEDTPTERGLRLVDLERGAVVAEALPAYQIQWVRPAPDGSVYVFGTTEADLGPYEIRLQLPSLLWRLEAQTLAILAERQFTGYRYGHIVPVAAAETAHETSSTAVLAPDCPVTQPLKAPFVPPRRGRAGRRDPISSGSATRISGRRFLPIGAGGSSPWVRSFGGGVRRSTAARARTSRPTSW